MFELLLMIAFVGIVAGILVNFVPMPEPIKKILIAAAAIGSVIMLVNAFQHGGIKAP